MQVIGRVGGEEMEIEGELKLAVLELAEAWEGGLRGIVS